MADEMMDKNPPTETDIVAEGTDMSHSDLVDEVLESLSAEDTDRVRETFLSLHAADAADVLQTINSDQRRALVDTLGDDLDPEILVELDETVRDEIIEPLSSDDLAAVVSELETDDAVHIIGNLDEEDQRNVLESMVASERSLIEESLSYPENSAGRLMQREMMSVPMFWSVGETIDFMRESAEQDEWKLPEVFYDIFVVDPKNVPIGIVHLSLLLKTKRPVPVSEIMSSEMKVISVDMDQEDVAFLFRQRDIVSAPVVDAGGRLVGAITIDDVVDVIDEEYEEDMMRMGGVTEDDLYRATLDTTRARFSWLLVNLFTAVLASIIIGFFQGTIEQVVALAVLMPIVASMGGNAGTQTLTVAVRALATRELTQSNVYRQVWKELMVGCVNGVLFAILSGVVAWLWFDSYAIGVVISLAMVINLVVAGFAGTAIPVMLDRAGIDPAIASSVFLTTVTDVVGFLVFLGLGAWILL